MNNQTHNSTVAREPKSSQDIAVEKEDCNLIVMSDLHICEGYNQSEASYSPSEHFFSDEAFRDMLDALHEENKPTGRPLKLIINGDFMDFVRARSVPDEREQKLFRRYFRKVGLIAPEDEFDVHPHEKIFGLRTEQYKSVWKLHRICKGHPIVMAALARFIARGNRLVIINGNHDLEFTWPAVQAEFVRLLAKSLLPSNGERLAFLKRYEIVRTSVEFCQRAYIVENQVYIEHGHQYEKMTRADRDLVNRNGELLLPPGSILNRYIINAIEHLAPFVTRVGSHSQVLRTFIAHHRWRGLRLLMRHFPIATKMLLRGHKRVGFLLLMGLAPYLAAILYACFALFLPAVWDDYAAWLIRNTGAFGEFLIERWFISFSLCIGTLGVIRKLLKIFGPDLRFRLHEACSKARKRMRQAQRKVRKFIVLGHTHLPIVKELEENWWYINTGSWVPEIKHHRHYPNIEKESLLTFASFVRNGSGQFDFDFRVWLDQKRRSEPFIFSIDKTIQRP